MNLFGKSIIGKIIFCRTSKNIMAVAYVPTHLRYSSWMIGVIAGYIFHSFREKTIRIPRVCVHFMRIYRTKDPSGKRWIIFFLFHLLQIFNLLAWGKSLLMMAAVIFAYYPYAQPNSDSTALEFGLYEALSRVAWSIALCYIIFACAHGYGGPVNWFLSHPLWQPLSRLSYSIYLVYFPVIIATTGSMKTPPYFTELNAVSFWKEIHSYYETKRYFFIF